jgi:hypothetical protein
VALNTSQLPVHPSMQRVQIPLLGTTLLDRFAVRVASLELGLCIFIVAPFYFFFIYSWSEQISHS